MAPVVTILEVLLEVFCELLFYVLRLPFVTPAWLEKDLFRFSVAPCFFPRLFATLFCAVCPVA